MTLSTFATIYLSIIDIYFSHLSKIFYTFSEWRNFSFHSFPTNSFIEESVNGAYCHLHVLTSFPILFHRRLCISPLTDWLTMSHCTKSFPIAFSSYVPLTSYLFAPERSFLIAVIKVEWPVDPSDATWNIIPSIKYAANSKHKHRINHQQSLIYQVLTSFSHCTVHSLHSAVVSTRRACMEKKVNKVFCSRPAIYLVQLFNGENIRFVSLCEFYKVMHSIRCQSRGQSTTCNLQGFMLRRWRRASNALANRHHPLGASSI